MKLEELAGALSDIKQQLFASLKEKAVPEANNVLLSELRKRIMQGAKTQKKVSKPAMLQKQLNKQQSKFLKNVPQSIATEHKVSPDVIRAEKKGNTYVIGIDSTQPQHIKDLAKVTESDLQQYYKTINEEAKNQLDQLQ